MKKTAFLFSVLTFCLVQSIFAQQDNVSFNPKPYLIGPGDEIKVSVLGEKEFDLDAVVDEKGNIYVPYTEDPIRAMCKNERELRADVVKAYSKFLKNPQVGLRATSKSRPPVTISGEIKVPGNVVLTRQTRLQEIIAFSGGPNEDAGGLVQVLRPQAPMCGSQEEINQYKMESANIVGIPSRMYSLSSISLGSEDANPIIYPGDLIFIQKAKPVYFTGEIVGRQNLKIPEGGLSLYRAISMQNGLTREAKSKDVKIYRLKPDSTDRTIISVNLDAIKNGQQKDVMLEPYDIVEVDKAKKSIMQTVIEIASGSFRQAASGFSGGITQRILY